MNITTIMNVDLIPIILPYLYSDVDRVHLLQTCREFVARISRTTYVDKHPYIQIKHLPYLKNFRYVEFNFTSYQRSVTLLRELTKTVLGTIPDCVTHLYYDSDIPINTLMGDAPNVCEIKFSPYFNKPIVGLLPASVKKIWLGSRFRHPLPDGYEIAMYPIDPWGGDDGW